MDLEAEELEWKRKRRATHHASRRTRRHKCCANARDHLRGHTWGTGDDRVIHWKVGRTTLGIRARWTGWHPVTFCPWCAVRLPTTESGLNAKARGEGDD